MTGGASAAPEPRPSLSLPAAITTAWQALGADDVDGFRAGVYARGKTLAAKMQALERQHAAGLMGAREVAELWAWVAYLVVVLGYPEDTTAAQYARSMGRLMTWSTEFRRDYAALTLSDFDAWQKWLFITHRNATDWRANQLAAARQFYQWRHTRGIGPNCAVNTRISRRGSRMARKYTDEQLRAMLMHTANRLSPEMRVRDRTMLLALLATGARREEISKMSPHEMDLGVQTGVIRFHGKGAKEREVPIEGPVVQALSEWMGVRDGLPFPFDPDAVFVGLIGPHRGNRMGLRTIENVIAHHAQGCKVRSYGVHRFRVNFATALYDAGAGLEEIRVLLGHESIETTRRYIAVSDRARKTRLSSAHQHRILGTKNQGQPRWMSAALGRTAE